MKVEAAPGTSSQGRRGIASQLYGRPFLKWAGGKGRVLKHLATLRPRFVERLRHVEPFAGGAAMFFGLSSTTALLADVNENLMRTYRAVRDEPQEVLTSLEELASAHSAARYYDVRARYNAGEYSREAAVAAAFIYLNKTCFNGLHRVNRRGEFNVPIGRYTNPGILDEEAILAASARLAHAELAVGDFESVLRGVTCSDFVYLDPPYEPVSETASFRAYAETGFSQDDQRRLRKAFGRLDAAGVQVMLTNSDVPFVRALYRGYAIHRVEVRRSVACTTTSRGMATELVIRNYE
jgi:DNA adenine methylase